METPDEYVQLVVYWGGQIIRDRDPKSVEYSRSAQALDLTTRDATLKELIGRIYQLTNVDANESKVKVITPYSTMDEWGKLKRTDLVELNDEKNWQFFLDPLNGYKYLELYVEFVPKTLVQTPVINGGFGSGGNANKEEATYINMIAELLLEMVRTNPSHDIKFVQEMLRNKHGLEMTRDKAWLGLKEAIQVVYGTWETSVIKVPRFVAMLQKWDSGNVVKWQKVLGNHLGQYKLGYIFWAFKQSIDAFQHCRPVISVDGTQLWVKYKHKLLIAIGSDANHRVLPLAFAVVDDDTVESWTWFLQLVSKHLVLGRCNVCLISSPAEEVIEAAKTVSDFHEPLGRHRFCLRHLSLKVSTAYKNAFLQDKCYDAGKRLEVAEFNNIMDSIEEANPEAHHWLNEIGVERWSLAHDEGWRHGMVTANLFECINGILKGVRCLPIVALIQVTYTRTKELFVKRLGMATRAKSEGCVWSTWATEKFRTAENDSVCQGVETINKDELKAIVFTLTKYHSGKVNKPHVVSIANGTCSCGEWMMNGVPCSHAVKVCQHWGLDAKDKVRKHYSIDSWIKTYEMQFHKLPDEISWDTMPCSLVHNPERLKFKTGDSDHIAQTPV